MAYVSVDGFGGGSANRAMLSSGGGFGISNLRNITGLKAPAEKSSIQKGMDWLMGVFGGGGSPTPDKADMRVVDTPSGSMVQSGGGVSQNMLLLGGAGLLVAFLVLKKKR